MLPERRPRSSSLPAVLLLLALACPAPAAAPAAAPDLLVWFDAPAREFTQSLPLGSGRLGAMVFGGVGVERFVLNESSLWSGSPQDADRPDAAQYLPEIRRLLLEGKNVEAERLTYRHFTPRLADAARKTLEARGDVSTGWSLAHKMNLWARLGDGERAHRLLRLLLTPVGFRGEVAGVRFRGGTYENLFDSHPPFQIDGNFGAAAGVAEMLLQSHGGTVRLLPALPAAWAEGEVRGLRARGGFELDLSWGEGKLKAAALRSKLGGVCRLAYGPQVVELRTRPGGSYSFDGRLAPAREPKANTRRSRRT